MAVGTGFQGRLTCGYKDAPLGQGCCSNPEEGETMASIGLRWVSAKQAKTPWLHSMCRSHLLRKFKGCCFRCLARDHQVFACHNPIRSWACCHCGHTSKVRPSHKSYRSSTSHKTSTISHCWHCQTGRVCPPSTSSQHCLPTGQASQPDCTHQQQAHRQDPFLSRMHRLCFNCLASRSHSS